MLNVNNRNTRERCEICLKLAINITEQLHNVVLMFRPFSMIIFLFLYELMINYRQTSLQGMINIEEVSASAKY